MWDWRLDIGRFTDYFGISGNEIVGFSGGV
jgi:hypothetical protein